MKNKSKNKLHKNKVTKVKKIKNNIRRLRGGVESDSPRTKSIKKIQATTRGRSTRQTKKATTFNRLLESGAVKYKKAIPTLDLKGINLKGMVLSKRSLNGIDLQKVDLTKATLNGTKLIGANLSGSIFQETTMKKSDLTNSICKNCKFINSNINSTSFVNANLEGSIFEFTDLIGSNFQNANLKGCLLRNTIIFEKFNKTSIITNFKNAILDNCKMTSLKIFEKVFLDNSEMVTFKNIEFDPEKNNPEEVKLSNITFKNSKFKKLQFTSLVKFMRNKITKVNFNNCLLTDFMGFSCDYDEVSFTECKMEKSDLRMCVIKLCNFENNNLKDTNFTGSIFQNTGKFNNNNMTKSIFTNVKGLQGSLIVANNFTSSSFTVSNLSSVKFMYCNFTSSSFNGTILSSVRFMDCNLQGSQFIPVLPAGARGDFDQIPSDLTNAVFENCKLQSITFQSTLGLQGRNFEGQDLRRCTFIGCDLTGTIFRDCNLSECVFTNAFITDTDFTGSNRENTVFDEAIGREENETLTPAERGIQVEGDNDIPAIYPTDVHAAFRIIKKNNYYDTISSYVNNWQTIKDSATSKSNDVFVRWINTFLDNVISNTTENKDVLMNYKNRCMRERLNLYNYKDNIVSGSNTRITWLLFLYVTLLYVEEQIPEFKELYVTDVIMESGTTYGEGGLSCDRGINERFIIKLRNTMYMMMDLPQIKNNIDKVIEFNKILNAIDPTKTLPTTIDAIEAERVAPEREYIDFTVNQGMRDEWYEIHGSEGSDPFDENTGVDEAISSYNVFLKDKFKYVNLDNQDKERYNREMNDEIDNMRKLLDEGAGMTYLFLGGRKMRGGHGGHGMWGMGGAKFRLLCRKIFGKTKCKKMRNTKKLKILKRKGTRKQ